MQTTSSKTGKSQRIIVTGASDGIGLRLANQCGVDGAEVVAIGRRERTDITPPLAACIHYVALDLTDINAPNVVTDFIIRLGWDDLDLLVNCAGVGLIGPFSNHSDQRLSEIINVNVTVPLLLTHNLARFLAKSRGLVLFIGSTLYQTGDANFSVYSASKAAIHGAAKSLALEWQNKIRVKVVHPGPTATAMHSKIGMLLGKSKVFFANPEDMAREIVCATKRNRRVIVLGYSVLAKFWLRYLVRWMWFHLTRYRPL